MNFSSRKPHHVRGAHQNNLALCKHEKVLTHHLTQGDQEDFCRRLNSVLANTKTSGAMEDSGFNMNFLTPSIRGTRAKSMLTTTLATKQRQQSTGSKIEWTPEQASERDQCTLETLKDNDCFIMSAQKTAQTKHRNATLSKSKLPAPTSFRNCEDCGSFFINRDIVAVKPRQYCFRAEILPSQLICTYFQMQVAKPRMALNHDVDSMYGQEIYLNGRKRIIDGVYKMGVKFRQARETIHIAIEIVDHYFLAMSQEMNAKSFKIKLMHPAAVILHQVTAMLISSKFDEIDDNIVTIRDLREYVAKQVTQQKHSNFSLLPSFDQIVECERKLMFFYKWDLKFILPLNIVRVFLANGVIFSNEFEEYEQTKTAHDVQKIKNEWSRSITTESLSISDLIVSKGNVSYRSEASSNVAAAIIYLARKNILEADSPTGKSRVPNVWPQELVMITRCTESKAKRILVDVLRPTEQILSSASLVDTTNDQKTARTYSAAALLSPNGGPQPFKSQGQEANSARPPKFVSSAIFSDNRLQESKTKCSILEQPQNSGNHSSRYPQTTTSKKLTHGGSTLSSETVAMRAVNEDSLSTTNERTKQSQMPPRPRAINFKAGFMVKSTEELRLKSTDKPQKDFAVVAPLPAVMSKVQSQRLVLPSSAVNFQNPETRHVSRQQDLSIKESTMIKSLQDEVEPCYLKQTSPQNCLPPVGNPVSTANATAVASIEKIGEGGTSTQGLSETTNEGALALQNLCNDKFRTSCFRPKESLPGSIPFSNFKRPENELGMNEPEREASLDSNRDFDMAVSQTTQTAQAATQNSAHQVKKQGSMKMTRKNPVKKRYVEVKREQMAKNETMRQISKKKSANKLILSADNQIYSPTEISRGPQTTKHESKPSQRPTELNKQSFSSGAPAPAVPTSLLLQKVGSSMSTNSNEYFSVRPKMMEHVNQQAQIDILRSSSIEYEAHLTHGSEQSAGPIEFSKNMARRRTRQSQPSGGKVQVLNTGGSNISATNQQSTVHASFFQNSNVQGAGASAHQHAQQYHHQEPSGNELACPGHELHDSLASNQDSKATKQTGSISRLPNIKRTSSTSGSLLATQNSGGADFSSAVDRYGTKQSVVGIAANSQQAKYLNKHSSGSMSTTVGNATGPLGSTMTKSSKAAASMRNLIRSEINNVESILHPPCGGMAKAKSNIFGGGGSSINSKQFSSIPQNSTQPIFTGGTTQKGQYALRKGPSFNQMNTISTPSSQTEVQQIKNLNNRHGGRLLVKQDSQVYERKVSSQKLGGNQVGHMQVMKSNSLIATQQQLQHNRSSSNGTRVNNSQLLPVPAQRHMPGQVGSSTLQQMAADEAIANLKHHHQTVFQSQQQQQQAMTVTQKVAKKSGSAMRNQQSASQSQPKYRESVLNSARNQQTHSTAAKVVQRNKMHGNLGNGGKLINTKGNFGAKMLNVESGKQSMYLSNQSQSQRNILFQGARNTEADQQVTHGSGASGERHLKTSRQRQMKKNQMDVKH